MLSFFFTENVPASERNDEWKMLFTCRNTTTDEIVVLPKKSRAMLDQILFRKMLGVDGCKIMKLKKTDSWKLVKLPFTNHLMPSEEEGAAFVDLPQEKLPVFDLVDVPSPFEYLDKKMTTGDTLISDGTTESIQANVIDITE